MAEFNCPHCNTLLSDDQLSPGETYSCPRCQGQFIAPGAPAVVSHSPTSRVARSRGKRNGSSWIIWLGGAVACLIVVAMVAGNSGPSDKPASKKPKRQRQGLATSYMVKVIVHDDTKNRSLDPNAEVWFRGFGSWFLKDATRFGSATENLAIRTLGEKDTLHIYPDGREGKEIVAPLMMTQAMNPRGSVRDAVQVSIDDNSITVFGLPIKAATGELEQTFSR